MKTRFCSYARPAQPGPILYLFVKFVYKRKIYFNIYMYLSTVLLMLAGDVILRCFINTQQEKKRENLLLWNWL